MYFGITPSPEEIILMKLLTVRSVDYPELQGH